MVSPWYSPGRSLGPQGHSTSLCYPHDALQPADLWLRGPGKSSLRPHPSRAPAQPLSPALPPRVFTADLTRHLPPFTLSASRPGGCQLDLANTLDTSLPRAGARAGSQTPPLPTATGLPLEECFPAFPGIGWRRKHFIFTPQARIQAEKKGGKKQQKKQPKTNSASSGVFDWLTSQAHPLIGLARRRGLVIHSLCGSILLGFGRLGGNTYKRETQSGTRHESLNHQRSWVLDVLLSVSHLNKPPSR